MLKRLCVMHINEVRLMINICYTSSGETIFFSNTDQPHHRKCIDGKITGCGNCVGYCKYCEHPGYLTKDLRKKHDCIKKNCNYYVPKTKTSNVSVSPFAILAALV